MRVGLDANISIRLVSALAALYDRHTFQQVGAGKAESDVLWLDEFASNGGEVLIGLDRRIMSRPHEVGALQRSGLKCCFFDFKRAARLNIQAAHIAYSFPILIEKWESTAIPRVLRYTADTRLTMTALSGMEFFEDGGAPRVRKIALS